MTYKASTDELLEAARIYDEGLKARQAAANDARRMEERRQFLLNWLDKI